MIYLRIVNGGVIIEFIVCDDEKEFRRKVKKVIDKIYMKNDESYKIIEYEKYDKNFDLKIKDHTNKIYILDIEMREGLSGIDIARKIRKEDYESIIIMVTSHSELGYDALCAQIMLLAFISKYDQCLEKLEDVLRKAIMQVNSKKVIKLNSEGVTYVIKIDDILYVMKDTVERKCIVKTLKNEILVNKTLSEIKKELDERFYESHRSCIINTRRLDRIDWKNNIIYFENGCNIDLISRDKKKGLKEYIKC